MATKSSETVYTCGIDIGSVNFAVAFVSLDQKTALCYKGDLTMLVRYGGASGYAMAEDSAKTDYERICDILGQIPEFINTAAVVIELQVVMNRQSMSRLDGIVYGFLKGRYPSITVLYNAAGIRAKFISDSLVGVDTSKIEIPKVAATKVESLRYTAAKFPELWNAIKQKPKLDDFCDAVVYAGVANRYINSTRTRR